MTTSIPIATRNAHKVAEINNVLSECGYRVEPVEVPKIEVQSPSLERVALVAASTAYSVYGEPIIVEDAGLFVEALNGFPGPYSSYVFKTIGINGVLRLLERETNRRAYFLSVIAFAYSRGVILFSGRVDGLIALEPRGSKGFGFDPIFIPEGSTKTFAEMTIGEKNRFSHRAKASRKLCKWLENERSIGKREIKGRP